jgi:hypothetical protein
MRSTIIAFAALVLAGGAAAATAQTNAPTLNAAPTVTATPSGPGAPTMTPSGAQNQNPAVNPNAAGTQTGSRGSGATAGAASGSTRDDREHSGSQSLNANTHPLKALKASRHARRQPRPDQPSFPHRR